MPPSREKADNGLPQQPGLVETEAQLQQSTKSAEGLGIACSMSHAKAFVHLGVGGWMGSGGVVAV